MTRDLLDAIAAWEATAREAVIHAETNGSWPDLERWEVKRGEVAYVWDEPHTGGFDVTVGDYLPGVASPEAAAHIAANDPAHVLRLCAALREVVEELHKPGTFGECQTCWNDDDEYELPHRERFPCPTLRALASVWDEPGDSA